MVTWTGYELLVYGGVPSSADDPALATGIALDPATAEWRELEPSPVALDWWPTLRSVWTGEWLTVVGNAPNGGDVIVLAYSPDDDTWTVSPPLPDRGLGAVVWTGREWILAGGDLVRPDSTAWGYDPAEQSWRQLPDPPIPPVEGMEGVWTGTEAIFIGGYSAGETSPAVAYSPVTESWRHLSPFPLLWRPLTHHELVWTGDVVIAYSGHTGSAHKPRVLLYDLETDTWNQSATMPITPRERLAGAWTGTELILWGGTVTYPQNEQTEDLTLSDGAMYDPQTDSWTLMAASPLSPRCDHGAAWTEDVFIVFGGFTDCEERNSPADNAVASYHPGRDKWSQLNPGT